MPTNITLDALSIYASMVDSIIRGAIINGTAVIIISQESRQAIPNFLRDVEMKRRIVNLLIVCDFKLVEGKFSSGVLGCCPESFSLQPFDTSACRACTI